MLYYKHLASIPDSFPPGFRGSICFWRLVLASLTDDIQHDDDSLRALIGAVVRQGQGGRCTLGQWAGSFDDPHEVLT
jgi:hypothetical protein